MEVGVDIDIGEDRDEDRDIVSPESNTGAVKVQITSDVFSAASNRKHRLKMASVRRTKVISSHNSKF